MFFIPKPDFTINDTYPVCIALISVNEIRVYLDGISQDIYSYAEEYDSLATEQRLNELPKYSMFLPETDIRNDWLVKLYTYYLSKSTNNRAHNAHAFYKKIFSYNTEQAVRRCSYCNANKIEVIDHFLPESKYHALSVNPMNLVPVCNHCNNNKKAYEPNSIDPKSVLIHPYYDDIRDISWLKISLTSELINNIQRVRTLFYVNPDITENDEILFNRIKATLDKINFNDNICPLADDFINTEIAPDFRIGEYSGKSDDDLRRLFTNKAIMLNQQGYGLNHWKVAIYDFLSTYPEPFSHLF